MATVSATFTFGLPEDVDSDQLLIYESATKNGTYSLVATVSYSYGERTYEYDSTDDTKWYKIKFNNSTDAEAGPLSDAVYGGDFSNAAPFLAVSTTTDGAMYATVQDVYDYTNLTPSDVTSAQISTALKRARAVIDLRTVELNLDRFGLYTTSLARKKHNATLRIVREAEINIALGHLYRGLADDNVMTDFRANTSGGSGVSIGSAQISDTDGANKLTTNTQLLAIADRYMLIGASMLQTIQPTSVRFTNYDIEEAIPRFVYPFNGYGY